MGNAALDRAICRASPAVAGDRGGGEAVRAPAVSLRTDLLEHGIGDGGYTVQSNSGNEEYEGAPASSRQAMTDVATLRHTMRVLARNAAGDGTAAEATSVSTHCYLTEIRGFSVAGPLPSTTSFPTSESHRSLLRDGVCSHPSGLVSRGFGAMR